MGLDVGIAIAHALDCDVSVSKSCLPLTALLMSNSATLSERPALSKIPLISWIANAGNSVMRGDSMLKITT